MMTNILVGYATVYCPTWEVAEAVSGPVRACGLPVDCRPARKASGLT